MTRLALLVLLAAVPAAAAPLTGEQAADALSAEGVRCAAAYAVGLRCFADTLAPAAARDFRRARDAALARGYADGRRAGLSDAALLARTEDAARALKAEAGEGCRTAPAMLAAYGRACRALVRDPEGRLRQLTTTGR